MDVSAIFELPVHIWVMCDSLAVKYPTGYGELRFSVVLPIDRPPLGGAPDVPGIASRAELTGDQVVWAQEYGAFIPESLRPATALHRVAMTDVDGPAYDDHRSWLTPDYQLARYVNRWFDDVRTWAEVATGQDLDPNHRVYDAEFAGDGLTFIEPSNDGAVGITVTTPHVRPLRAQEWADILRLVRDGKQPPLEEVLSRDARAAHRRDADRRAIIDAATALEIALGRHVRSVADQLPATQRQRISERTALGDYISIAEHSGLQLAVPVDRLRWLSHLRNDAAHRGAAPSHWDASDAVQVMIDFLGAHGRLRRTRTSEPDGGEWVLADSENAGDEATSLDEGLHRIAAERRVLPRRADHRHEHPGAQQFYESLGVSPLPAKIFYRHLSPPACASARSPAGTCQIPHRYTRSRRSRLSPARARTRSPSARRAAAPPT